MFKFVALIPARGGSKGIKNKNLKKINGLSLTDLAIKIAKKSKIFSKIILSTDNKSILNSGKKIWNRITSKTKNYFSRYISY